MTTTTTAVDNNTNTVITNTTTTNITMSECQEAEGEQGRGRISELAETLNQMEANIAEVTLDHNHY